MQTQISLVRLARGLTYGIALSALIEWLTVRLALLRRWQPPAASDEARTPIAA